MIVSIPALLLTLRASVVEGHGVDDGGGDRQSLQQNVDEVVHSGRDAGNQHLLEPAAIGQNQRRRQKVAVSSMAQIAWKLGNVMDPLDARQVMGPASRPQGVKLAQHTLIVRRRRQAELHAASLRRPEREAIASAGRPA